MRDRISCRTEAGTRSDHYATLPGWRGGRAKWRRLATDTRRTPTPAQQGRRTALLEGRWAARPEVRWRKHFLSTMRPKYLPELVERDFQQERLRDQGGREQDRCPTVSPCYSGDYPKTPKSTWKTTERRRDPSSVLTEWSLIRLPQSTQVSISYKKICNAMTLSAWNAFIVS